MPAIFRVVASIVGLAAVAASTGAASSVPGPLAGVPLRGKTHLRLLVANIPPFVLDVDTGRRTRVTGLKPGRHSVLSVQAVGQDAIVWLDRANSRTSGLRAAIYVVRHGTTKATWLARASSVAPAADGLAVWLKSYLDASHCTLREIGLDGGEETSPRPIPCSTQLVDSGSGAFLVDGTSVVDPGTGETVLHVGNFWAVAGDFAVTMDSYNPGPITLTDLRSGERWWLRYPSRIGGQGGSDEAAVHPNGRLVALSFADPAYQLSGTQVTDVWLLDLATRQLRQLPDMPAAVHLKFTSMRWTSDGRLVLLAETEKRSVVVVWRPGRTRIRVRPVPLPTRNSGSDSFVAWTTPDREGRRPPRRAEATPASLPGQAEELASGGTGREGGRVHVRVVLARVLQDRRSKVRSDGDASARRSRITA
jgi:hypothetical protein